MQGGKHDSDPHDSKTKYVFQLIILIETSYSAVYLFQGRCKESHGYSRCGELILPVYLKIVLRCIHTVNNALESFQKGSGGLGQTNKQPEKMK
jgi:hypothetical protein